MATPKMMLLALAAASATIASPAIADVHSAEVKTIDLDLSKAEGLAQLQRRIDLAVRKVCRAGFTRDMTERHSIAKCMANAHTAASAAAAERIASYNQSRRLAFD
jgi:UrcA family protein